MKKHLSLPPPFYLISILCGFFLFFLTLNSCKKEPAKSYEKVKISVDRATKQSSKTNKGASVASASSCYFIVPHIEGYLSGYDEVALNSVSQSITEYFN